MVHCMRGCSYLHENCGPKTSLDGSGQLTKEISRFEAPWPANLIGRRLTESRERRLAVADSWACISDRTGTRAMGIDWVIRGSHGAGREKDDQDLRNGQLPGCRLVEPGQW